MLQFVAKGTTICEDLVDLANEFYSDIFVDRGSGLVTRLLYEQKSSEPMKPSQADYRLPASLTVYQEKPIVKMPMVDTL